MGWRAGSCLLLLASATVVIAFVAAIGWADDEAPWVFMALAGALGAVTPVVCMR